MHFAKPGGHARRDRLTHSSSKNILSTVALGLLLSTPREAARTSGPWANQRYRVQRPWSKGLLEGGVGGQFWLFQATAAPTGLGKNGEIIPQEWHEAAALKTSSRWKAPTPYSSAANCRRKMLGSDWRTRMVPVTGERRLYRRFPLQISIAVLSVESSQAVSGMTHDVSARGVYFYVSHDIGTSSVEFILTFPSEITWDRPVRLQCQGRVVRVEPNARYGVGVGVFIENYKFLPQA